MAQRAVMVKVMMMVMALAGAAVGRAAETVGAAPASAETVAEGALREVRCGGAYRHHLQGVCIGDGAIYWCFTSTLVKTDLAGQVQMTIPVPGHHGDLCYVDGKLYIAVNIGKFNALDAGATRAVWVYDAKDLSLLAKHPTPEALYGAGGIAHHNGRFIVVGGLPKETPENYVFEYDANFRFVKKHTLPSGYTLLGIQTAAYSGGHWWFGCYGKAVLKADDRLERVERLEFDAGTGIVPQADGSFLIARGSKPEGMYTSTLVRAVLGADGKLVLTEQKKAKKKSAAK